MLSRRFLLPALLACCVAAAPAANSSVEPFEGKWKLDTKETKAKGGPEDLEVEIRSNGADGLVVRSKYREPKNAVYPLMWVGIMTTELPLTVGGSETTNQIGPFAHVSRTSVEGNRMVTDWRAALENGQVEGQWIRTVSNDGKQMTLQIISKASDGRRMDQTLVFRRK